MSAANLPLTGAPSEGWIASAVPGVTLCTGVALGGAALARLEHGLFGRAPLEPLVLSILLGAAVRSLWTPGRVWRSGVDFSAKTLLEVAVVCLGASISASTLLAAGPALLGGVIGEVAIVVIGGYGLCRLLGLQPRMSVLVACGNAICGNSAIAAVAPVIGADGDDVIASIAFTAVLGVLVVLGLPHLGHAIGLTGPQYGVLAGLTVYAVPQVLAATAPLGATAIQVGTLIKLVRVLMLGPVCVALSLLAGRLGAEADEPTPNVTAGDRPRPAARRGAHPPLHQLAPWFILGFLAMIGLRTAGAIPAPVLPRLAQAANLLTLLSMAALGLGVDVRVVASAGGRVVAAATLSLVLAGGVALTLIRLLAIG